MLTAMVVVGAMPIMGVILVAVMIGKLQTSLVGESTPETRVSTPKSRSRSKAGLRRR